MHFVYDDASNLTETTDAKGQRITYTYDGANRIRTENTTTASSAPAAGVSSRVRRADQFRRVPLRRPSQPPARRQHHCHRAKRKGALAWVEDLSGEEHTSYDARGRVEWVVKRIPDPQFRFRTSDSTVTISSATRPALPTIRSTASRISPIPTTTTPLRIQRPQPPPAHSGRAERQHHCQHCLPALGAIGAD